MIRTVKANGKTIEYDLQIKSVKNINLRIHPDGKISVSANRWVRKKFVDDFVASKADFILKALEKYKNRSETPQKQHFTEEELRQGICDLCREVYPYYEKKSIKYPQIKFRKMKSRWGSCHPIRGIITFNTNLIYAPIECIEYVVWHEFTHFLQANHSPKFYEELELVCPDYKERRKKLKEVSIL